MKAWAVLGVTIGVSAFVACGPEAPPPQPPPPPPVTSATAPIETASAPIDAGVAPAVADKPGPPALPTELTDEQKKQDEAAKVKIAAFVDAYSNLDAVITKDGKHLVFRSNRSGLPQAYVASIDKPADAPKPLTTGTERVSWAHPTHDGKYVIFTSDEGADENFRLFRVGLDGQNLTPLTPGPKMHRDPPALPRMKANVMVYSAREASEVRTHVFVQDISGGDPKEVYVDPMPGFVVDVSPDGAHALFVRLKSASEQELLRVDLDGGPPKKLYPQSDKKQVGIDGAVFSTDGKRAYLTTDDGGEGAYLVAVEGSGIVAGRYKEENPSTATLSDVVVSPKGDRLAVTVDAGGSSSIEILDAKTLKVVATAKTPLGTAGLGEFSEDGKSLTIRLASTGKPMDVFDVSPETGALKPLRRDARPGLEKLPPVDVSQVKTPAFDGLQIPINLYLPRSRAAGKTPAIVLVHGGPASSSKIGYSANIQWFVSQGYAVVEPNIRGSTGFGRSYELADNKEKRADALKDLESVNAWTRAQPWCDDDRIVVMGGSYGGYMTLMALSRQPMIWRAGVDLVGISNLVSFMQTTAGLIRSVLTLEFGDLEKERDLLVEWSPMKDIAKIQAPLFVYQGQNDPRVPRSEADAIVNALRDRKIPVEYMVAPNEGHSLDRREVRVEYLARVSRFLGEQLKAPAASTTAPAASGSAAPPPVSH